MHRIDTKTAQKDKFGAGKNGFTRGNPQTGTPATDLDDDYFDMLQEELCSVVEASGASLEKARHDQLLTALRALLLSRKNPFGDIKSDGTVKTALENLGLGEAAKRNVGNGENQIPDMSFWTVTGGNGNFVIRQPDGLITQMVTVSISGPVAMNGMTDNAYAITGSNKSYIATATLPFVFPNKVLGVIPLVSTTAYGGVSSNITGSYATAVCSFAAVRGNNTIVFKVDKPLNAAFPSDTSVSALIIGR
ncbi:MULTISPECIES: hypothetical protein [Enterobacteriaceae]|jgi:hypothetical protein|uniref:Uncharacterized protein n=2 Tax=Escherichia coli TaxID=562 RepID=A0A6C9NAW0_ECOLX|nr:MULTISPECIES: hypothetical protein [Enterobacteriaceae]EJD3053836.1 hypothetical protein [Salmonella enterica]EEQ7290593.1 hypothetical protein [Escherichia coli]EGO0241251.1 hypothetical protein [Escherichia coli]EHD2869166.1 hypothetical protein [Escherichia coli]EHI0354860.1 hypothetical protein [Escherichia coli]